MAHIRVENEHNCLFLRFGEEITLDTTREMKEEIASTLAEGDFTCLVADLSQVRFIDSSGIGFLVFLNAQTRNLSRFMCLYRPAEQVRKTLDLVQLTTFFKIYDSHEELLASLPL